MKNLIAAFLVFVFVLPIHTFAQVLKESPRNLPLAYDVDVVVVGGSTGAVEAAVAAAKDGARVFLAAPGQYLGEDVCGTMRLFLGEDESASTDLARKVFDLKTGAVPVPPPSIDFTYKTETKELRGENKKKPVLSDGVVGTNPGLAVQFTSDVRVVADLRKSQGVREASVAAFVRERDFKAESLMVELSEDSKSWRKAGQADFKHDPLMGEGVMVARVALDDAKVRYVRFNVKKSPNVGRVLLAELYVAPSDAGASQKPKGFVGPFMPLHIKKTLDAALIEAGVDFLYGCMPTDVLRDEKGRISGIVMGNRAGSQAVRAKVIIDATADATVARLAGAKFTEFPKNSKQIFEYVTVGGKVPEIGSGTDNARLLKSTSTGILLPVAKSSAELIVHQVEVTMKDGSFASFNEAEMVAREILFHEDQRLNTELLSTVRPDAIRERAGQGGAELSLEAFKADGIEGLYVLGPCADLSRETAASLLKPTVLMAVGERIGKAAAADAAKMSSTSENIFRSSLIAKEGDLLDTGEVRDTQPSVRWGGDMPKVRVGEAMLPVLGNYDVVVVGGGTAGSPAGIMAAREGAKVLVLEYQHMLGGISTVGLITKYWWGYKKGFPELIPESDGYWNPRFRADWLLRETRKAGGEVWFGVIGNGALVENNTVKGVVVVTPQGRGVVLAGAVIDATSNADIAAAAGARVVTPGEGQIAVQGTGLPPLRLGARDFVNTDFTIAEEHDMLDMWHVQVYARHKYKGAFDTVPFLDTRERRRVAGVYTMTILDQVNDRSFPDTIVMCYSNLDAHGFSTHPYLETEHPDKKKGLLVKFPYRCILPETMDGLLVIGLGMSVEHDALAVVRMQSHLQNQGAAAAYACVDAVRRGIKLRDIDVRALQQKMVALNALPVEVSTEEDSFPLSDERFEAAVKTIPDEYKGSAVLFTDYQRAIPLLKKAYSEAEAESARINYAHMLGLMGDATGVDTLIKYLSENSWDQAWNYKAMGNFGSTVSYMDSMIMVLGRLDVKQGLDVILEKARALAPSGEFSHYRAISHALTDLRDPRAIPVLVELLSREGMQGHAYTDIEKVLSRVVANPNDVKERAMSTTELYLATALYLSGDKDGIGRKILENYMHDLRGYWAGFARNVLNTTNK